MWQLHVNVNLVQYIMYAQWFHEMNILCFDQILSKYSWEHPWNMSTFVYGCITYTPLPLQCKQYFTANFWSIFDPSPWHCLRLLWMAGPYYRSEICTHRACILNIEHYVGIYASAKVKGRQWPFLFSKAASMYVVVRRQDHQQTNWAFMV